MSLGTALLQPETLRRSSFDDVIALVEDLARAAAIILEDAAAAGPMASAAEKAVATLGAGLAASLEPRRRAAEARLRARIAGASAEIESLARDAEGLARDPAAIIGLVRRLLARLKALADSATLPVIRAELQFWTSLVEDDLGLSPAFLGDTVVAYVAALRAELAAITPADLAAARRLSLCESVLARLSLRAAQLRPPDIDVEPLARMIDALLRDGGIAKALREFSCALDGIQATLEALVATGKAVRQVPQPIGAGVVQLQNSPEYSWYASWLLNDEDIPLLGLTDISKPREFLTQLKGDGAVERNLREELLQPAERAALQAYDPGGADPTKELMLTVLAGINRAMQAKSLLERGVDEDILPDSSLNDKIRDLRFEYVEEQALFLFNRRVVEHLFDGMVEEYPDMEKLRHKIWHGVRIALVVATGRPRNQVFVTGDRRYVMCDDKPIHVGENVNWYDAPLFSGGAPGAMWFKFDHVSAEACEILAQVLAIAAEGGKAIWHFVDVQPGHEFHGGSVGGIEVTDAIQQILFGRPVSAYFLEMGGTMRSIGKLLDSVIGLKGIATLISSFQGTHGEGPFPTRSLFWLFILAGDALRAVGPIQTLNTLRDLFLSFFTLWNFRGPRDSPSGLEANPAWNHRKQGPFVSLADTLFGMLLISLYPRDDYSIEILASTKDTGGRRLDAIFGYWLGGSAGLGLAAGLSGSVVAQIIAWAEDVPRFFKTGGISAVKMFLLFWIYNYSFKENSADGGRYRPGGGSFRGYPDRKATASPYLLPYARDAVLYVPQANLGFFSHNYISATDFQTPADSSTQQVYSYDFAHDFRQEIRSARAGVIWSFEEKKDDGSTGPWNFLIIKHSAIDPVHDKIGASAVQTYAVYGHLAKDGVTGAFGTTPGKESDGAGMGRPVAQGETIALAGDTGNSAVNHLHIHILPDDGTGKPDRTMAIPFVFEDVGGDGVPKSLTWYRAGSA